MKRDFQLINQIHIYNFENKWFFKFQKAKLFEWSPYLGFNLNKKKILFYYKKIAKFDYCCWKEINGCLGSGSMKEIRLLEAKGYGWRRLCFMVLGGSVVEEKKATVVGWFAQKKKIWQWQRGGDLITFDNAWKRDGTVVVEVLLAMEVCGGWLE
jgi:hypothetical protein